MRRKLSAARIGSRSPTTWWRPRVGRDWRREDRPGWRIDHCALEEVGIPTGGIFSAQRNEDRGGGIRVRRSGGPAPGRLLSPGLRHRGERRQRLRAAFADAAAAAALALARGELSPEAHLPPARGWQNGADAGLRKGRLRPACRRRAGCRRGGAAQARTDRRRAADPDGLSGEHPAGAQRVGMCRVSAGPLVGFGWRAHRTRSAWPT